MEPLKTQIFEATKKLIAQFTVVNEDFNFSVERRKMCF